MMPAVFARLVGQDEAVATLAAAAAAAAAIVAPGGPPPGAGSNASMTHAWLFTGPPGSGRSVAARAFAAALQCPHGGCGACAQCHTTLAGTHADVRTVVPEGLSIQVKEMRELVKWAASAPAGDRWQIVLIEDADRLTERAGNALLKAIEEPSDRTVFLLCSPSTHPDDISVTIRSRCRVVALRTPSAEAIAAMLTAQEGADPELARVAAAAAQGHVGRARRLIRDAQARARRDQVLRLPRGLRSIGHCFEAAATLVEAIEKEAKENLTEVDAREKAALEVALGAGGTGRGTAAVSRGSAGAIKELEDRQKARRTRAQRDALDRALVDLAGFYRDVLVQRLNAPVALIHPDFTADTAAAARTFTPESVLRRLSAVLACRTAVDANVPPRVAVEAMMVSLWEG